MWRSSRGAGWNTMSGICGEIRHPSGVHEREEEVGTCRGLYPRLMSNAPSGQTESGTPRQRRNDGSRW